MVGPVANLSDFYIKSIQSVNISPVLQLLKEIYRKHFTLDSKAHYSETESYFYSHNLILNEGTEL